MVRERDRATIENKLKALRATLVTAGHEGGVEAVLDAIVDRERARLTAEYVAATPASPSVFSSSSSGVFSSSSRAAPMSHFVTSIGPGGRWRLLPVARLQAVRSYTQCDV